jgi:hypothetical protein
MEVRPHALFYIVVFRIQIGGIRIRIQAFLHLHLHPDTTSLKSRRFGRFRIFIQKFHLLLIPALVLYRTFLRFIYYGTFSCCSVSVGEITPADKPVKRISDVSMASRSSDGGSSGYLGG